MVGIIRTSQILAGRAGVGVPRNRAATGLARLSGILWLVLLVLLLAAGGCSSLPEVAERRESMAVVATDGVLAREVRRLSGEHPGQSGVRLLGDGLDAFAARVALADAAVSSIDVQYYLFHNDMSGKLLIARLLDAADRGVRVRLLIDDMDTAGRDRVMAAIDTHPSFEIRLFNPFANRGRRLLEMIGRFGQVSRRMHNKSFTVDGLATVVGGRNVGDEYFSAHPDVAFGDLDMLAVGAVSREVSEQFDLYWNSELAFPISALTRNQAAEEDLVRARDQLTAYTRSMQHSAYADRIRQTGLVNELAEGRLDLTWGEAHAYYDLPQKLMLPPEDRSTHMTPKLRPLVEEAQDDLLIFSPYFVPGDAGVDFLAGLAGRDVKVRVLTNSLASTDVAAVHAGYSKYREPLLARGVGLYEVKPQPDRPQTGGEGWVGSSSRASLHAKTFVIDRSRLFVGSLNLDPRSAVLNTEMGIVFDSPRMAGGLADWFEENRRRVAYELTLEDSGDGRDTLEWKEGAADGERSWTRDPHTNALQRMLVGLLGFLPIEEQL